MCVNILGGVYGFIDEPKVSIAVFFFEKISLETSACAVFTNWASQAVYKEGMNRATVSQSSCVAERRVSSPRVGRTSCWVLRMRCLSWKEREYGCVSVLLLKQTTPNARASQLWSTAAEVSRQYQAGILNYSE